MASVLEDLKSMLSPEEWAVVQAKVDPKLVAKDKKNEELFGYWTGIENGTTTEEPVTTTAAASTHTPTLPSAAATTSAPTVTAPTTASVGESALLLELRKMNSRLDDGLKNVITKDQLPALGAALREEAEANALRKSNELAVIRETHREEFGKPLDSAAFEKFVLDSHDATTKRNKYPSLTDAYNAMVADERVNARITKGVDEQVKQKLSGVTVPGQTTSTALSPAQQVMAKAKKDGAAGGGSNLQNLIDRAAQLEKGRADSGAVN